MAELDSPQAADADARAYQRGSQEINEQSATWSLFMVMATWGTLFSFCTALFAFLILSPNGSFFGALIPAVVLAVIGGFVLKQGGKKKH